MIDFTISSETQMVLDLLRKFIQNELAPYEAEVEETQVVRLELANELRKKAKDLGLFALGLPEEVGGGGLNTIDMCL